MHALYSTRCARLLDISWPLELMARRSIAGSPPLLPPSLSQPLTSLVASTHLLLAELPVRTTCRLCGCGFVGNNGGHMKELRRCASWRGAGGSLWPVATIIYISIAIHLLQKSDSCWCRCRPLELLCRVKRVGADVAGWGRREWYQLCSFVWFICEINSLGKFSI
jgi:hypothetical protein